MTALYNENDPCAAQWLRNLSKAGHIAEGHVDERSIRDLTAAALSGVTQAHFFAGIGGWSYALRLAGWPDDEPVWTGSCPCQPFSAAGRRKGFADERHLAPVWLALIRECRPPVVFGEQVASPDGLVWLDLVLADLEDAGYACAAADLCAACVGAPHIRQRLYFVAYAKGARLEERDGQGTARVSGHERDRALGSMAVANGRIARNGDVQRSGEYGLLAKGGGACICPAECDCQSPDSEPVAYVSSSCPVHNLYPPPVSGCQARTHRNGAAGDTAGERRERSANGGREARNRLEQRGKTGGFWHPADGLFCRDGKYRPVVTRLALLAPRVSGRMAPVRTDKKQEITDAAPDAARPDSLLPSVQPPASTEEVRKGIGGQNGVSQAKVLRSKLHGESDDGRDKASDAQKQPQTVGSDAEISLRALRPIVADNACPPQGREPAQQRALQLADFVRLLPSALAFSQLEQDDRTENAVRSLLGARTATRAMLEAPHAVQKIWRSVAEEEKGRIFMDFVSHGFVRVPVSPLARGWKNRVGLLRGFGNSIVPQVAAVFVRAAMDAMAAPLPRQPDQDGAVGVGRAGP